MNLEDFVKQITVSLQDLDYSKQNGYAKGITNIFLKQLQDLEGYTLCLHIFSYTLSRNEILCQLFGEHR